MSRIFNIASLLTAAARERPDRPAVIAAHRPDVLGRAQISYRELDDSSSRLAAWLMERRLPLGSRVATLIRPGPDFVIAVFGLFKAGLAPVMADPGLGRARLLRCLEESRPSGLAGLPLAHLICLTSPGLYKKMKLRLTVGRFWGGAALAEILKTPAALPELPAPTRADDLAAVLFTSGSTGPAKGVVYTHAMFAAQVEAIREGLDIRPGGRDLATFPLFALFAPALGLTSVIPDFNASRPAQADPQAIVEPIIQSRVTSLFASPALLKKAAAFARKRGLALPSLERVISAGAPVPPGVAASFRSLLGPEALLMTPYGATEGMPLSRIEAREILDRTRPMSERGLGICVGRPLPGVRLAVIKITDEILETLTPDLLSPVGEIGEIIAQGPMVARSYFERPEETRRSIIPEEPEFNAGGEPDEAGAGYKIKKFWRRMGDAGWLDAEGRLWFCGRLAHRVETAQGVLFSIPCEAIFNNHPQARRSALVGVGPRGAQKPAIVVEPETALSQAGWRALVAELAALARANPRTRSIEIFLRRRSLPVDPRHNAKIDREALAIWAAKKLGRL